MCRLRFFPSNLGSLGKIFSQIFSCWLWKSKLPHWGEDHVAGSGCRVTSVSGEHPCWQFARKQAPRPHSSKDQNSAKQQSARRDQVSCETQNPGNTLISMCWDLKQRTKRPCTRFPNHRNYNIINVCSLKLCVDLVSERRLIPEVKTWGLQHCGFENDGFNVILKMRSFLSGHLSFINSVKIFIKCLLCPNGFMLSAEWVQRVSENTKVEKALGAAGPALGLKILNM